MQYTIDAAAETVTITCTVGDLYQMESLEQRIYATPSTDGKAMQCYVASSPRFRYDFAVATATDFIEAVGWTELSDFDPDDPSLADEITLTVPRERQIADA